MRQIIGLFLLSVFIFNLTGVMLVFKIQQMSIKQEIQNQLKREISEDKLHVLTLSAAEVSVLNWEEENEFTYKGKMYDVVKKELLADSSIRYYCIDDQQETELFSELNDLIKKNTDSDNPISQAAKKLLKFLSLLYINEKWTTNSNNFNLSALLQLYKDNYTSPQLNLNFPPPKAVI